MASIRTARTLAVAASLPLAAALFTGVAQADVGAVADNGSNSSVAGIEGSGVGGDNHGNSTTSQQVATGSGASNQSNIASLDGDGHGHTTVGQDNEHVTLKLVDLW
ncbi:hypothetical protein [Streptomyces sp. URMC 123]|uniref:hypothetical protein n=1 Tax=Streptomyces sp. URMC 123 TaxID=3423403 RepID=UPI003F1B9F37